MAKSENSAPKKAEQTTQKDSIELTPAPIVETTTFKEEFLDAPGAKVATVTTDPSAAILYSSVDSKKFALIHNLVTDLVIQISHQAAIDLIKSEPNKYKLANEDQIAQYKLDNDGESK